MASEEIRLPIFNSEHPLDIDEGGTYPNQYYIQSANQVIKLLLERDDMTQQDLADRLGMKRETVNRRIANPASFTKGEVDAMCRLFNVSIDYLRGITIGPLGRGTLSTEELSMFYDSLTDEQRMTVTAMVREMVSANSMQETINRLMLC